MDTPREVPANHKTRILLVEDEPAVRRSLQLLLQADGFDVRAYATGKTLLADPTAQDAACLVADYRMEECDGLDTLRRLRETGWTGPAVLITAFPSADLTAKAVQAGFDAVLEKPLRQHVLVRAVERLVRPKVGG